MRVSPFGALFFTLILAAKGWCSTPAASPGEQREVAASVRAIFEAKCLDCHGPNVARPKGKFGYVLDLQRIAANPKFVVPGQPDQSDLYDLIFHDEMPGEDADVDPLTPEEKEKVRRWIEIGAPSELPAVVENAEPKKEEPVVAAVESPKVVEHPKKTAEPLWKHSLRWIGKFHSVSTHFPVALMLVAVVAEAIGWWTRREDWMRTVRFLVVLAAFGGLAATGLGWMNAFFSSYDKAPGAVLWWHRWLGSVTCVWALICAGLACLGPCVEGSSERQRFRGALLFGAALVSITGFLGGALINGLDHYIW